MSPRSHLQTALDRARGKAYTRLLPLLFACYVIAYVDRSNVAIAKLTMARDLPGFDNAVIGLGSGVFFIGYFLLEIPGSLIVEHWSARKWICRIMVTWGLIAMLTAAVKTPPQFYGVRFFLGLAEAGFFPGVIVFLTHWFPARDRSRALAYFLMGTPVAQIISPKISNALLTIGTTEIIEGVTVHHPLLFGLHGWQWVYIFWGLPAVVLGIVVYRFLPDRPADARWLTAEERTALEAELVHEKSAAQAGPRLSALKAMAHPKVLLLAAAYFLLMTANYGTEFFLPSILQRWYNLKINAITWLAILPPILALIGQLFVGWNSDRCGERRLHALIPIGIGAVAMAAAPFTQGHLAMTIACFMTAYAGLRAYQPAFWSLPNLFLAEAAAAGSIGLINSFGNLGGFLGPYLVGKLESLTGSFIDGIYILSSLMAATAVLLLLLDLKPRRETVGHSD